MAMGGDESDRDVAKFLFGLTDNDLVVDYLWPWVTGRPMASDLVTVADVSSTPPLELLAGREQAYFICKQKRLGSSRMSRTMEAGKWKKQSAGKQYSINLNTHQTLQWKKSPLSLHLSGENSTSGFVMYEYQLCDPPGVCSQPKRRKTSVSGASSSPPPPSRWVLCLVKGKVKAEIFSDEKPKLEKCSNQAEEDCVAYQVFGMPSTPMQSQDTAVQCSDLTDASSFYSENGSKQTEEDRVAYQMFDGMLSNPAQSRDTAVSDLTDASSFYSDMFQVWKPDAIDEVLQMIEGDDYTSATSSWHLV